MSYGEAEPKELAAMYKRELDRVSADRNKLRDECEQLRVQLAGCGVAALGGTSDPVVARRGQYGWSPAYQDVLDLRLKYETLIAAEGK